MHVLSDSLKLAEDFRRGIEIENYKFKQARGRGVFCSIAVWIMLFSNRVNSCLKDRKEKTEINIKIMGLS